MATFFGFLLSQQGFLAGLLGFARLAGQGFLDSLEHLAEFGLVLLAGLEFLVAVFHVVVELGQHLLALAALGFEVLAAAVEVRTLGQQLLLLAGDVLFDIGQLAQGLVEGAQLLEARLAQVVVVAQGAGELLGVLLVEQQLEVFLATVLVGRPGLNGDQSLLFNARALEFFFLCIESLQLGFAFLQLFLQGFDLLLELAHLGLGALEVFLHAGLFLLQLAQQFFQLGNVLTRGVQLLLGLGTLVGERRIEQASQG
ncbi:hypothetical protein D9M73_125680 [compost metagenome]